MKVIPETRRAHKKLISTFLLTVSIERQAQWYLSNISSCL